MNLGPDILKLALLAGMGGLGRAPTAPTGALPTGQMSGAVPGAGAPSGFMPKFAGGQALPQGPVMNPILQGLAGAGGIRG